MNAPVSSQAAYSAISDMESGVRAIRGYVQASMVFGVSPGLIHPKACEVLADGLEVLADRLERQWAVAFDAAVEARR